MAPANANTATHVVVADTGHRLLTMHMVVPLASLRASDQPRHLNTEAVDRMTQSLKEVGLIQPITVRPGIIMNGPAEEGYRIVAGHHRVAAARALGWTKIDAFVIGVGVDHLSAELIEIDENLCRAELTPAQRAGAIKRRKQIWEAMHPEQTGGTTCSTSLKDGRRAGPQHEQGFAAETAAITGQSKQDINRHVARAEALGDDINVVVGTFLDKGVELDALKKLPEPERKDLVKRAASGEKVSAKTTVNVKPEKPEAPPPSPRGSRRSVRVPQADVDRAIVALNRSCAYTRGFVRNTRRSGTWVRASEIIALKKKLSAAMNALDAVQASCEATE